MSPAPKLMITVESNRAQVAVIGEGAVRQAVALKRFYQNALMEGIDEFTLDLKDCPAIDSTFLGTVLGLALKLKKAHGQFRVRNVRADVLGQMASLGVDKFLSGESKL